jgi:hypothetical protein
MNYEQTTQQQLLFFWIPQDLLEPRFSSVRDS